MATILFTGGGTGGHLLPGIALANQILSLCPEASVAFLVPGTPVDVAILSNTSLSWQKNPMRPLPRSFRGIFSFPIQFTQGFYTSHQILKKLSPHIVVGLGGYGCLGPGILAAWKKIPLVLLESNRVAGKVVKWLSPFSQAIYSSDDVAGVAKNKIKALGIPIRTDLPLDKNKTSSKIGILVMGGSQGATCMNQAMHDAMPLLLKWKNKIRIVHLCGGSLNTASEILKAYEQHELDAKVFSFTSNMKEIYQETDIAICRAGGSTLAEITAMGIPAILIPYAKAAHDHQTANAIALQNKKAAVVIREQDLNGQTLFLAVEDFLQNPEKIQGFSEQAKLQGKPQATLDIANDILCLATAKEKTWN